MLTAAGKAVGLGTVIDGRDDQAPAAAARLGYRLGFAEEDRNATGLQLLIAGGA
jgi:hypothetical protein